MVSGIFYTAIAKYSGVVVSLVVTAILARILTSEDFGIVAVATIIIAFFSMISDMGIAPAIIQNKQLDNEDLNNIFSFTIWSGIAFMLIFIASAWGIASYYKSEILIPICHILSVNLFFSSANIVPNALLQKNKRFKFIGIRSLSVQIAGGTAAVVAALSGAGLYALLINPVFSSISLFFINYSQYKMRAKFTFGWTSLKKIFGYSAYQLGFNVINYFSRNLDKLLMGRHLGMSELGYYEKSYRLMMYPLQLIPNVVSPVMHPIFSEMQDDLKKLSDSYLEIVKILAFIGFPLSVFLVCTSSELILLLFGNQWEPSVSVFQILSITVSLQIILSTSGAIFQASNSTKALFWCGGITAAINIIAICIGVWGFETIDAIAWCISTSFTLNFIITYYIMYYKVFRLPWRPFWKELGSPVLLSIIMLAVMLPISYFLPEDFNIILSFIIKIVAAFTVYFCFLKFTGIYDLKKGFLILINKAKNML